MNLRDYQRAAIDALFTWFGANPAGNPLLVLPTGCHARGTRVVMYDGSTKAVEDVQIGDLLLGPDSAPRRVLRLISGSEPMYKITPKRGGLPFVVNENHVLSLVTTNEGKDYPSTTKAGQVEAITVKDYLEKSKSWKHLRKLHRTSVVHFEKRPVPPFDPWALGALLGDGCIKRGIEFTSPDVDVLDAMLEAMRSYGLDFSRRTYAVTKNIDCWHVRFVDEEASRSKPNRVTALLRQIGVFGTDAESKFIPDEYKTGSLETRANVLAGLLDTDGHYDGRGYDYVSKSEHLARDLVFIARSLGITAKIAQCEKRCQTGGGGTYWRVHLSGNLSWIPLRCARKRAAGRRQIKNPLVTGFTIEPVGVGEFFGFTLDGDHLYVTDDFFVHHNSGKSVIIASFVETVLTQWPGQRVLMLTHVKELIAQNFEKLNRVWPLAPAGIYSASLKRRDKFDAIIYAGIQSVWNKAMQLGWFDLVLIDEAHLVNIKQSGMYRKFLEDLQRINPHVRVIGLTATAFRTGSGDITEGEHAIFTDVAYEVRVLDLIEQGYLCPLVSKRMAAEIDTSALHIRNGDFVQSEMESLIDRDEVTEAALDEVMLYGSGRRSWLFFCAGVRHAEHVREALERRGISTGCVTGETPAGERDRIIDAYRRGELRAITNANVLTTGFDAPGTDLLAFLRPTDSPGLYVQMMGRGMRPLGADMTESVRNGKKDCLVLDFAGNVRRHGPVDEVRPWKPKQRKKGEAPMKACPECQTWMPVQVRTCPECGHEFPVETEAPHGRSASDAAVLSTELDPSRYLLTETITECSYTRHEKAGSPPSMRVDYYAGYNRFASEWVCLEHGGVARAKAVTWWMKRAPGVPVPRTIDEALQLVDRLAVPGSITINTKGKYAEIVSYDWTTASESEREAADDRNADSGADHRAAITGGLRLSWM